MSFYEQLQQETTTARQYLLDSPILVACQRGDISLNQYTRLSDPGLSPRQA